MPLNESSVHLGRSLDQDNFILRERLSGAINAISISPEGNAVVVAGREGIVTLYLVNFTLTFFVSLKNSLSQQIKSYRNT